MPRGCLGFLFPSRADPALEVAAEPDHVVDLFELRSDPERYAGAVVETWGKVQEVGDGVLHVWPSCTAFVADPQGEPGEPIRLRGVCRGLEGDALILRPCVIVDDTPGEGQLRHRRGGGQVVAMDGEAWVLGGWDTARNVPRLEVEVLGPDGAISEGPALPGTRVPSAIVVTPSVLVAIGGMERPGQNVGRVDILAARRWTDGPEIPHPWEDGGAACCGEGVLIAGGIGVDQLFGPLDWRRETWFLGPNATAWEPRARLPQPRRTGRLHPLPDGRLAWIGGWTPEGEAYDALIYDPEADTWTVHPCSPDQIGGRGVGVLPDGRVLLAGGHLTTVGRQLGNGMFEPDTHEPVATCHLWDPNTGEATSLPELSVARDWTEVLVLDDGRALVLGGGEAAVDLVDVAVGTVTALELPSPRRGCPVVQLGDDVLVLDLSERTVERIAVSRLRTG